MSKLRASNQNKLDLVRRQRIETNLVKEETDEKHGEEKLLEAQSHGVVLLELKWWNEVEVMAQP